MKQIARAFLLLFFLIILPFGLYCQSKEVKTRVSTITNQGYEKVEDVGEIDPRPNEKGNYFIFMDPIYIYNAYKNGSKYQIQIQNNSFFSKAYTILSVEKMESLPE